MESAPLPSAVQLQTTLRREAGVEVRAYGVGVVAAHRALVNVVPDVVSQPDRIRVGAKRAIVELERWRACHLLWRPENGGATLGWRSRARWIR
jgi:hypothetical protein